MKSAGYYVNGEDPPDTFIIVNQNVRQFKGLMEKGDTVIIDGHLSMGADRLFIERIDDKTYSTGKGVK